MRRRRHVLMDQAGDGTTGGAPAAPAPAAAPAAPAAPAPAAAPESSTLLSAAAAAVSPPGQPGAAPVTDPFAAVPEKYRVMGADGKIDTVATFAKVDAARAQLEQRMGEAGLPPEKPEGYKPDAVYASLKEATGKDFTLPPEFLGDFNKFAHDAKLSQSQYDKALGGMIKMTEGMVAQGFERAMADGKAELAKVWGADAENPKSERMQNAVRAFNQFVPPALRNKDTMDAIGNHPVVMQVLEAVGRELKSDRAPNEQGGQVAGVSRLDQIYADPAYSNARDPRHEGLVAEAKRLFDAGHVPTAMKGQNLSIRL